MISQTTPFTFGLITEGSTLQQSRFAYRIHIVKSVYTDTYTYIPNGHVVAFDSSPGAYFIFKRECDGNIISQYPLVSHGTVHIDFYFTKSVYIRGFRHIDYHRADGPIQFSVSYHPDHHVTRIDIRGCHCAIAPLHRPNEIECGRNMKWQFIHYNDRGEPVELEFRRDGPGVVTSSHCYK